MIATDKLLRRLGVGRLEKPALEERRAISDPLLTSSDGLSGLHCILVWKTGENVREGECLSREGRCVP